MTYPYNVTKEQYEEIAPLVAKYGGLGLKWFRYDDVLYAWGGDSRERTTNIIYLAYFKITGMPNLVPPCRFTSHEYLVYCAFVCVLNEYMHSDEYTGGITA